MDWLNKSPVQPPLVPYLRVKSTRPSGGAPSETPVITGLVLGLLTFHHFLLHPCYSIQVRNLDQQLVLRVTSDPSRQTTGRQSPESKGLRLVRSGHAQGLIMLHPS